MFWKRIIKPLSLAPSTHLLFTSNFDNAAVRVWPLVTSWFANLKWLVIIDTSHNPFRRSCFNGPTCPSIFLFVSLFQFFSNLTYCSQHDWLSALERAVHDLSIHAALSTANPFPLPCSPKKLEKFCLTETLVSSLTLSGCCRRLSHFCRCTLGVSGVCFVCLFDCF